MASCRTRDSDVSFGRAPGFGWNGTGARFFMTGPSAKCVRDGCGFVGAALFGGPPPRAIEFIRVDAEAVHMSPFHLQSAGVLGVGWHIT